MNNFYELLEVIINSNNIEKKLKLTKQIYNDWVNNKYEYKIINKKAEPICKPGLPVEIKLVSPKDLLKRKVNTLEGRAILLHAIAHIEFNAINLALDAAYRFRDMPKQYYTDWLEVAVEECEHFVLLNNYLKDLGYFYGSFPAHGSLWEMAEKTQNDVLIRMALVPKLLEARGLDATPGISQKFSSIKDTRAVKILYIIEKDEVGHVQKGNYWFNYMCQKNNLNPLETFKKYINIYAKNHIKKPLSLESRKKAGFTELELEFLETV